MDVYCGLCKKMVAFADVQQLVPCLHTICKPCIQTHGQKSKLCPVPHCYTPLAQAPDVKWNPCENEQCVRKLSPIGEVFRTLCLHELCAKCVDDAYKSENPLCPVVNCAASLLDEDDREKCAGPCGSTMDTAKIITLACCQMRMCALCAEKWTEGKGGCPPGKCQPPERRQKKGKKQISITRVPCQGQPECEGEVLRNFPSDQECEHSVCVQCLHLTLMECEMRSIAPICPAESCRLPYRCETVLALKALFPEKASYFNRFDLESNYSLEALKDDSVMRIFATDRWKPTHIQIKICFCEDEENQHMVEFDAQGPLGDLLREIRRVLKIMPWDKVYGYFRRENGEPGADKPIEVRQKTLMTSVSLLKITKDTLILVDITGIVNSKKEQMQSVRVPVMSPNPKR